MGKEKETLTLWELAEKLKEDNSYWMTDKQVMWNLKILIKEIISQSKRDKKRARLYYHKISKHLDYLILE